MPYQRKGRGLKMFPPAGHLAAWAAGGVARAAARSAAQYAAKVSMRKAAVAGAAAAAAGTAATMSYTGKRKSAPNRAGGYTSQRGKKYARTGGTSSKTVSTKPTGEFNGPLVVKTGRIRPLNLKKVTALGVFKRILRWQRVNPMNRAAAGVPPGAIILRNFQDTASTECPVHLMCLNATMNSTTGTQFVHYSLNVNDNGTLNFVSRVGQTSTGADGITEWATEWKNNISSGSTGKRFIIPQWYDIRFLCYGAKAQPTRYEISIIRLKNTWLDPLEAPSNAQEAADRQALWQGLAQQMMVNPILPVHGSNLWKSKVKVIKRVTFTLQPSLNTELDTSPASQVVKMFVPDGRVYDYLYHTDGFTGAGADNALNTVGYATGGAVSTDFSEVPKPRDRLWLMIRCLDTTPSGADTDSIVPSYDVIIRKKEAQSAD